MSSPVHKHLDIHQIYATYMDIVSQNDHTTAKELLSMYLNSIQSEGLARNLILSDLTKLMSCLNLSVDSHQFNYFYDFVFFISCENGQKNITVNRAVTAWRLVLAGRFRLLNQWCSFVEDYQRHNISADTWQQVLGFCRCVNEDLDGYDPKGAWPVLVDDFVEHMYRINESNSSSSSTGFCCRCSDMQAEPVISSTFRGLNLLPGSKRKKGEEWHEETAEGASVDKFGHEETTDGLLISSRSKRLRHGLVLSRRWCWDSNTAEDSLAKGFEGRLLRGCCLHLEHKG